jgi:hypothetical protein
LNKNERERRAAAVPGSLPPRAPPADLLAAYTRCGRVPLGEYFVDDSDRGRGSADGGSILISPFHC